MKKLQILLLLIFLGKIGFAQVEAPKLTSSPSPSITTPSPPPIYKVVEEMPKFPGCEEIIDRMQREKCAEKKMNTFITDNLQYPKIAKDNGVKGTVIVQFIVEKDGTFTNAKVIQNIGADCGEEVLRILEIMPKWNPAQRQGKPVRATVELPIQFNL